MSIDIKVTQINGNHKTFILPGEKLAGKPISSYNFCDEDGVELDIITQFSHNKNDVFPEALYYLAFGKKFSEKDIWGKYRASETIIFFICKG
ncbi:MAG: hypothetical protein S4CHLAM20_04430 [Chlamydiia bacterium]|nr:hypothetical protein [Chlamydiia bacterium]